MVTNVMRFMTNCYIQLIETARQEAGFIVCKQQSCTVLKSWGSHGLNPTLQTSELSLLSPQRDFVCSRDHVVRLCAVSQYQEFLHKM